MTLWFGRLDWLPTQSVSVRQAKNEIQHLTNCSFLWLYVELCELVLGDTAGGDRREGKWPNSKLELHQNGRFPVFAELRIHLCSFGESYFVFMS